MIRATAPKCVHVRCGAVPADYRMTVEAALGVYGTAASLLSVDEYARARRRLLIGDVLEARGVRIEIDPEHRVPMTDEERWLRELIVEVSQ